MLELSQIKLFLRRGNLVPKNEHQQLMHEICRILKISRGDIAHTNITKHSIDARKKNDVALIYSVSIALKDARKEMDLLTRARGTKLEKRLKLLDDVPYTLPTCCSYAPQTQPIVVGAGCAGLFCALALAKAGLSPVLIERGEDAFARQKTIEHFNATGELNEASNIQFGLGGAGTFSDGKLTTGTKSPAHKLILEEFVEAGANEAILWDAKPHIGSDILPRVVTNLAKKIESYGGDVRFGCTLTDIAISNGRLCSVSISQKLADGTKREETLPAQDVILACGHSARDVFSLLKRNRVFLERKTFAMGVRIEHLQADIDRAQYGHFAGNPLLGAAPYKLSYRLQDGRSAFSFCMCPGGYVVCASSEKGGVCTNGMSLSDRAGTNANAGLLVNVFPQDLPGDDVLAGVELQRSCERTAYDLGGGLYRAPAQLVGDFMAQTPSTGPGRIQPTYPRGVTWTSIDAALPPYITETMRAALPQLARRLKGFDNPEAVLTGVETRSSSPVRITRSDTMQSVSTQGLWPCGEGAGYAGGIMSAATDGLRVAEALIAHYEAFGTGV
ncbi:MAG: NAD(P)/FAD-dependent oxidoreductase [Atopobiaceae bacterium]